MKIPWIIAHRGGAGHAPENTMAAFQRSVELGAHFIETDLQLTRDARFVAMHDSTLDRTTNAHGAVHESTLAQIKTADAGLWYDRTYAGERVPTLDDILQFAAKYDVIFYLEVKYDVSWGMHSSLVSALQQSHMISRTVLISFDPVMLAAMRNIDASIMTGLLVDDSGAVAVQAALDSGARQLCPQFELVSPELVQQAHRSDLQVVTWTVNEREVMARMIGAGVDGIMTDFPDRLQIVIENLKSSNSQQPH